MKNKDFDDHIKKPLEDLGQDVRQPNWKAFDRLFENEDIKDSEFDAEIHDKLTAPKDIITPPKGGFESIYATIEAENLDFDNKINKKLNTLPKGYYKSPQWDTFQESLGRSIKTQEDVIKHKASELIAFLLLITFINYAFLNSPQHNKQSTEDILHYAESTKISEEVEGNLDFPIKESTSDFSELQEDINNDISLLKENNPIQNSLIYSSHIANSSSSILIGNELSDGATSESTLTHSNESLKRSTSSDTHDDLPSTVLDVTSDIANELAAESITSDIYDVQPPHFISSNTLEPFTYISQNIPTILTIPADNVASWKERIQIGAYVGAKRNHIKISKDKSVLERDRHIKSYTWGVGAKGTYKNKKWAGSLGLEYFNMDYYLSASSLSGSNTEYTRTSLDYIKYEFLHIPIDIKYAVYEDARNSIFASAGMGINFLIASEYTIIEQNAFSPNTIIVDPDAINENSSFANLDYQDGLLEAEDKFSLLSSLRNNIYSKLRFGMGYERKLSRKSSIFCDVIWDYQLNKNKGIGPMKDNINHYSLNIGINYRLG